MQNVTEKDEVAKAIELGRRIKFLRKEIAKQRQFDFAEKALVNKNTLSLWETGMLVSRPIQPGNMANLIEAFKYFGIEVTARWLRYGEGPIPTFKGKPINLYNFNSNTSNRNENIESLSSEQEINYENSNLDTNDRIIIDEVKLFTNLVKQSVVTKVEQIEMLPMVNKGDWVGGVWEENIDITEEKICILELSDGYLHIALVRSEQKKELFYLRYFSNMSQFKILQSHDIIRLAPIIRIWCKLP